MLSSISQHSSEGVQPHGSSPALIISYGVKGMKAKVQNRQRYPSETWLYKAGM